MRPKHVKLSTPLSMLTAAARAGLLPSAKNECIAPAALLAPRLALDAQTVP